MTPLAIALLWTAMVGTSLLSGIFGMAGGLILVGVLLALMPVPEAMALHAVTQMASNGWRASLGLRHVRWPIVGTYVVGCLLALGLWSLLRFVPPKPLALIALGVSPFLLRLLPSGFRPDAESPMQAVVYGLLSMSLMLLTGVAGPLLDSFFLGGKLDRRVIVSTKAVCQVFGHGLKFVYFGAVVTDPGVLDPVLAAGAVVASMLGTTLARPMLEALTDRQYRLWAGRLITTIAATYVLHGTWLLFVP